MLWAPNFSSVKRRKFFCGAFRVALPGSFLFPYVNTVWWLPGGLYRNGNGVVEVRLAGLPWLLAMGAVNCQGACVLCHSGDPKTSLTLIFQIVRGRLKPLVDKYWPCYVNSFRSTTFVTSNHPSLIPLPQYLTHLLTHLFVSFRAMKKVRSQVTF